MTGKSFWRKEGLWGDLVHHSKEGLAVAYEVNPSTARKQREMHVNAQLDASLQLAWDVSHVCIQGGSCCLHEAFLETAEACLSGDSESSQADNEG